MENTEKRLNEEKVTAAEPEVCCEQAEPAAEPEVGCEQAEPVGESETGCEQTESAGEAETGCEQAEPVSKPGPTVQYYTSPAPKQKQTNKLPGWTKGLIIIILIIACLTLLATGCESMLSDFKTGFAAGLAGTQETNEVVTEFGYDYIGTVYIEGEMSEDGTGVYNHQYILNAIDAMIEDDENKGMILYVNTPGGTVFSADELYFKIKEYQEKTGRPVYSSMQSMAASGGYYISAPCDKIIANRNCWTGSIGVTMGTFIDVSELMDNLGIHTETITSGANKAMGNGFDPMTAEQRAIYQSLIDEAYDQFVEIVSEGRKMGEKKVRKLADGRIYTAKQALDVGLIDKIGTFEEAIEDMKTEYQLEGCEVEGFYTTVATDIFSLLGETASDKTVTDAETIEELMKLNGTFRLSYMAQTRK